VSHREHWERIYAAHSPLDVSWHQAEPRLSLELIGRTGMVPGGAVIDVGGGASLLVDRLLAQGQRRVAVLDLAENALAHARRRLGARAAEVEWYAQDVTTFSAPARFDVWHDRAVFHFLTRAAEREAYVRALRRGIGVGGQAIIAAFAPDGPVRCSGLDVVRYDGGALARELGAEFRLEESRAESHRTPAGGEQRFGYFRFLRVA
jgi:2-polyprenyl-3-methyl-5-hydroxy-6-metoxy-1,4-benzoquinol methylase